MCAYVCVCVCAHVCGCVYALVVTFLGGMVGVVEHNCMVAPLQMCVCVRACVHDLRHV